MRESVLVGLGTLLLLAGTAGAQVTPYEWVFQTGRNGLIDSNALSCDPGTFSGGTWINSEGCFTRTGTRCSANPNQICDLQIVPANRCTTGNLGGGEASCVWPHNAGRCISNPKVGCLSNAYQAAPSAANAVTGPSTMCAGLATNICDMTIDRFGDAQTGAEIFACHCQGTDPAGAAFETSVCGSAPAVCSDGDPDRDTGGFGWAFGDELITGGPGTQSFARLGPSVNGSSTPSTSPRYAIENPPSVFDPQRDAGTIGRTPAGAIRPARTTEARTATEPFPDLSVRKHRSHGDSFWSDPSYETFLTTGTFNTHSMVLPCSPSVGWSPDDPVAPGVWCSSAASDGLTLLWRRDLTPTELAANPTCPPNCRKDFDLTTVESEALVAVSDQDANAGLQLALQSGEGRQAGAADSLGVRRVTLATWLVDGDLRCRLGGWGNAPGFIGRCSDGPRVCVPGDPVNGDAFCNGQGASCRACNGPIDPGNADFTNGLPNQLGLPPGYSTHGSAELDLVAGQRLGLVEGPAVDIVLPVLLVGTSGFASAEFRDVPGEGPNPAFDLAELGEVSAAATPFGVGIGAGGSFANGSTLPIGEPCCAGGVDVTWGPAQPGDAVGALLRTFDSGPGANGIPACLGDNGAASNGAAACDQRLGLGVAGSKGDPALNTGSDDVARANSSARFGMRNGSDPTYNQVSALALRDASVFLARNRDALLKLNVSHCPIVGGAPRCGYFDSSCDEGESDGDGVFCELDNCPTVANADQSDSDADGVGNVCDNCTNVSNPREAADFLTTNPWATLSGGQRDDDHDGFGNRCDAKFPGVTGTVVNSSDLAQFRASNGKTRTGDTCGTIGTRPCAIFDLDQTGLIIGSGDLARFRLLNGKVVGPRCATYCTGNSAALPCQAGTTGSCL
jgi:hypothetical protein